MILLTSRKPPRSPSTSAGERFPSSAVVSRLESPADLSGKPRSHEFALVHRRRPREGRESLARLFRIGTTKPISASIKRSERERVQRTLRSVSFSLCLSLSLSLAFSLSLTLSLSPSFQHLLLQRLASSRPSRRPPLSRCLALTSGVEPAVSVSLSGARVKAHFRVLRSCHARHDIVTM